MILAKKGKKTGAQKWRNGKGKNAFLSRFFSVPGFSHSLPSTSLVQQKCRGFNAGAGVCNPVCVPSGDQLPSWCVFSTVLLHCGGIFLGTSKQEMMFERLAIFWKQSRACEGEECCKNSEVKKRLHCATKVAKCNHRCGCLALYNQFASANFCR